ncbi:hypothetical protein VTN02DRAFT_4656 [Thermoascus thermophilus]
MEDGEKETEGCLSIRVSQALVTAPGGRVAGLFHRRFSKESRPEPARLSLTFEGIEVSDGPSWSRQGGCAAWSSCWWPTRWDGGRPRERPASRTSGQRTENRYSRQHLLVIGSVVRLAQQQILVYTVLSCNWCSPSQPLPDGLGSEQVSDSPRRVREGQQLGIVSCLHH